MNTLVLGEQAMSIVYDLKVLRRIAIFVLNKSSQDLRSELYDYLVIGALSDDKERSGMTKAQINDSIEKDFKISELPDVLIRNSLNRLGKNGSVNVAHSKGNKIYILSQDKMNLMELMSNEYSKTVVGVKEKISKRLGEALRSPIDLNLENSAFSLFQKILATTLSRLGEECCYSIVGTRGTDLEAIQNTNMLEIIDEVLRAEKEDYYRDAEEQVFIEYISEPDENLKDYLFSLAQSYFVINVLRIDPECDSCTRESLSRKKVFLDTNVIVHALTGSRPRFSAADSALKLTNQLGIQLLFSKRTKTEYNVLIGDSKRSYGKSPTIPKTRFQKIRNSLSDGFLKNYELKKQKNPNLTFEGYIQRLEEIETVLRNRYSVAYDDTDYNEISEDPDLPILIEVVADESVKFGNFKSRVVAEHDAFHILLVQQLRSKEKDDILGPNYWFLTHDRSLSSAEMRFHKFDFPTSSVFLDDWVQMISPLLSPKQTKTAKEAYVELFASRLPVLSKTIDDEVFLTFQGDWVDDEDLTPQDIARIIGKKYLKDLHKKLEDEGKQLSEEDKKLIIGPIIEEIKSQKRNNEQTSQKVARLGKTVFHLKGDVHRLKETVNKQNSALKNVGHLIGALIFLLLWYVLFSYVLISYLEPWQAFIGAIIVAAVFGYLADFHGYKWLLERLLGNSYKTKQSED